MWKTTRIEENPFLYMLMIKIKLNMRDNSALKTPLVKHHATVNFIYRQNGCSENPFVQFMVFNFMSSFCL